MTRDQVHAALGTSSRETAREAEWTTPETKAGWPSKAIYRRTLEVYFDEAGRVSMTRDYAEEK